MFKSKLSKFFSLFLVVLVALGGLPTTVWAYEGFDYQHNHYYYDSTPWETTYETHLSDYIIDEVDEWERLLLEEDQYMPQAYDYAYSILTSTLNESIGMQGFEGRYAITSPDEAVEIFVQFVTPPSVALRLMQERGITRGRGFPGGSFEAQAQGAHDVFNQQLAGIPVPFSGGGIEILESYYCLFNGMLMRVPGSMVELIAELPEVYGVFPNVAFSIPEPPVPEPRGHSILVSPTYSSVSEAGDHPFFVNPEHMRVVREYLQMDYINIDMGITGAGVRVAVIDTGIYHGHPEFERFLDETGRIRGSYLHTGAFRDNSYVHMPWISPELRFPTSHGTRVSGAVIGIAPGIELWNYRADINRTLPIPGMSVLSTIIAAYRNGADVINMSFGVSASGSTPVRDAVNLTVLDGVVAVAAVGNSGPSSHSIGSPAVASLAISVGAGTAGGFVYGGNPARPIGISNDDILRPYSSRGPIYEHHIKPDIIATSGVFTTMVGLCPRYNHYTYPFSVSYGYTMISSGTSFAAPIIAGVAALLIEANPDIPKQDRPHIIKTMLMNTARQMDSCDGVLSSGAGFVQPLQALRADTLVYTKHYIPAPEHGVLQSLQRMSSLSFGRIYAANSPNENNTLPLFIENKASTSRIFTISNSTYGSANLSFSNNSITIAPGSTGRIDASLILDSTNILGRFYEGFVYVNDGERVVARVPFAGLSAKHTTHIVSTEAELRAAVAMAGDATIYLSEDITLINVRAPLTLNNGQQIRLRSYGETMHALIAGGNFDVIVIRQDAHFILDGVKIKRVNNTQGRGIWNISSTLTILDGVISGHYTNNLRGGGVSSSGHFTMYAGKITNNTATGAGGVDIGLRSSFTMHSGEISGNTASGSAGGVSIASYGYFTMYGGEISNNTAFSSPGMSVGGIENIRRGNIFIGADAIFKNNAFSSLSTHTPRARLSADDDVYYEFIHGTQWTYPFTQGLNNIDIGYAPTRALVSIIRLLNFELNGTSTNPTTPESLDTIQVPSHTRIMLAPSFPADPTRVGYTFAGWYFDANFIRPVVATNLMSNADDVVLYAKWIEGASNIVSTEAELRAAVAGASSAPTTIYLANDIILEEVRTALIIPAGVDITLSSYGNTTHSLYAGGNYDVIGVSQNASITIDGLNLTRQPGTTGRGVTNQGHLTLVDGVISGHQLTDSLFQGGGVENSGTFVMEGGAIYNNNATRGGGVNNMGAGATFIMRGGVIENNTSTRGAGGGVRVLDETYFFMYAGKIVNNTSTSTAGGVVNNGRFYMTGGEISGNIARLSGGGVETRGDRGYFIMEGGEISNNTAGANGGGIAISSADLRAGRLQIGAAAVFANNSANDARIPTSQEDVTAFNRHVHTRRWTFCAGYRGLNNYDIQSGGMVIDSPAPARIVSCEVTLRAAVAEAVGTRTTIYLTNDILLAIRAPLYIPANANITLRSYKEAMFTLIKNGSVDAIHVSQNASLAIDGIRITRRTDSSGIGVVNEGNLTLIDGIITGHRTSGGGVDNRGTFTMTGGAIYNNRAERGGGVNNSVVGSTFVMRGGVIENNASTVGAGGGVRVLDRTYFYMHGGKIINNTSRSTAGGIVNNGRIYMTGGKISGNHAILSGGGVETRGDRGYFIMEGGEISNNTAGANGGGIAISSANLRAGRLQISAGAIFTNNRARDARMPTNENDIAAYHNNIHATQWSIANHPYGGLNNFDIQSTGNILPNPLDIQLILPEYDDDYEIDQDTDYYGDFETDQDKDYYDNYETDQDKDYYDDHETDQDNDYYSDYDIDQDNNYQEETDLYYSYPSENDTYQSKE